MLIALALLVGSSSVSAQVPSGASNTIATAVPHTTVPFRIDDPGTKLPDFTWGFDLAWLSEDNVRRGTLYTGADMVGIMRLSFQTTDPVAEDLALSANQKTTLNERIRISKKYAPNADVNLNSDQEAGVHASYIGTSNTTIPKNWYRLIKATANHVNSRGLKVASVSPFNEPDYGAWKQGTQAQFKAIAKLIKEDADLAGVRVCGGNTLNNDYALEWYNTCKQYLDEGNTHQLAGSFDNFASFFQRVAADGKVGVGDELHNILECMVGSEYGMTVGIWWGTAEYTRSQFMKATRGTRMGYAENRSKWTAASVYRHTDGSVQGFGGTSERQAYETDYRFAAIDHDVFYDGQGPTREYIMTLPGGTGYQQGQKNAEGLVNIQGGEDIMPPLPTEATTYKIVNRFSGHVLAPANNSASAGTTLAQVKNANNAAQQWIITPLTKALPDTWAYDWNYFRIENAKNTSLLIDVRDWSLSDGGELIVFNGGFGNNEQWFIEYADNGWFYIRSRHSAMYLQTMPGTETQMKVAGRKVNQGVFTGEPNQQWRLLPEGVTYDAVAPAPPTELTATAQPASVLLTWTAPSDRDLRGYTIQRSRDGGSTWNVINRYIESTSYVDNTATDLSVSYQYRVLAQDKSLNHSEPSDIAMASPSGEQACIMRLDCDSLTDVTVNGNHAALFGDFATTTGKLDKALNITGKQFLQLPATIVASRDLTFTAWVNLRSTSSWQRIFDFGNDTDHYVFLSPCAGSSSRMRLAIKNGGSEQYFDISKTLRSNSWTHVAVTFAADAITVYLNGEAVTSNTSISDRPADFSPIFNYVGRSQFTADPMLKGYLDDIRIFNYSLSADDIASIANMEDGIGELLDDCSSHHLSSNSVFDLSGRKANISHLSRGIYIINGRKVRIQ